MVIFMQHVIAAGKFKAQCLQLMDEVQQQHLSIIITKHGKAVAELIPYIENKTQKTPNLFGYMQGTVNITGDIISPLEEIWDAEHDA
jgi:prevent-host-death family protein